jgi:hypothetical protein
VGLELFRERSIHGLRYSNPMKSGHLRDLRTDHGAFKLWVAGSNPAGDANWNRLIRLRTIAAVFIAIIAVATSVQFSGKRAPRHQPPLTKLQSQSLDELRREFNGASDRFRVILLLSPT